MNKPTLSILAAVPFLWAGGASFPPPTQHMADAESATRSAKEVGAAGEPNARLVVRLADEQIAVAKGLVAEGENERAQYVLLRARADAELGLALARESNAEAELEKAKADSATTFAANSKGAQP